MKKTKLERGITLIALIITIVVLLIIAVVTIGAVKESKIITHAQNAGSNYKIAQEKELIGIGYSEYIIEKNISKDATLKVEGAQVDSTNTGWIVAFEETNDTYEVSKDGEITHVEDKELVITNEKDLVVLGYQYHAMYNLNQEEVVPVGEWYDDENNDRKSDVNHNLGAYYRDGKFNIPTSFFEEAAPTEGDIDAVVTHHDGSIQQITFKTTDNKTWTCEFTGPLAYNEGGCTLEFKPNNSVSGDTEYHYLNLDQTTVMPLYKLKILGSEIVFTVNCCVIPMSGNLETQKLEPMYTDIENVSKMIVSFSDGTKKIYTKKDFYDIDTVRGESNYLYYSVDNPIIYNDGSFFIYMPDPGTQNLITSIIVEENGVTTKYNVTEATQYFHYFPGD